MKHIAISFLTLALLVGCGESEIASPASESDTPPTRVSSLTPNWVEAEHAVDVETRSSLGAEAAAVYFEAVEEHGSANWQALDAVARAHRETVDPEYRYIVDQFLSHEMLKALDEACSSGCIEARTYHVERLLEAGWPAAHLLEAQLAVLDGHWSAERVQEARHQSATNAETWLERQEQRAAKRDCGPGMDCNSVENAQTEAMREIREATRRLRVE